jgi:hypothetical protein
MFPVPANLQEGNNFKPSLSTVRPDQANLHDGPGRRFAVVQDSSGPKSQQRDILEGRYGVTAERHTCAQKRVDKHRHSEFHLSVAQRPRSGTARLRRSTCNQSTTGPLPEVRSLGRFTFERKKLAKNTALENERKNNGHAQQRLGRCKIQLRQNKKTHHGNQAGHDSEQWLTHPIPSCIGPQPQFEQPHDHKLAFLFVIG